MDASDLRFRRLLAVGFTSLNGMLLLSANSLLGVMLAPLYLMSVFATLRYSLTPSHHALRLRHFQSSAFAGVVLTMVALFMAQSMAVSDEDPRRAAKQTSAASTTVSDTRSASSVRAGHGGAAVYGSLTVLRSTSTSTSPSGSPVQATTP